MKEIDKVIENPAKSTYIRESHGERLRLLQAIQRADFESVKTINQNISEFLTNDSIDLLKRIEGNALRSHKNFMLSHNSLYALYAELGGLNPVLSHYMSEKYAIIIETTTGTDDLLQLHDRLLEEYSSPLYRLPVEDMEQLSKKVDFLISGNFMNPISVQELADKLFITREHLMRTYKKETGMTIQDQIQNRRLEEARHLLKLSNLKITTVAFMVGFNSSQYFSKVFKDTYNQTPSEYREAVSRH